MIYGWATELGLTARCWQTNSEGDLRRHDPRGCAGGADGLIVNPGAWTHYSYAIRDALEIFDRPEVEVHLSDVEEREEWRRHSVIADVGSPPHLRARAPTATARRSSTWRSAAR